MKRAFLIMLAAALGLIALPAVAGASRCQQNALGATFCAEQEDGSAVINGLGEVVCAPGGCVRESETSTNWRCSSLPGGSARWEVGVGASCDGGCITPEQTRCVSMPE